MTFTNGSLPFLSAVEFPKNTGITVEPGGALIVENAELTCCECLDNEFWSGITLEAGAVFRTVDGFVSQANRGLFANGYQGTLNERMFFENCTNALWARSYNGTIANQDIRECRNGIIAENCSGSIFGNCLLYTSPSPRDRTRSRMPSSA